MKAMKIALFGIKLSENLGGPSMFVSVKTALDSVFPQADYTLFVWEHDYESDKKVAPRYKVNLVCFSMTKWTPLHVLLRRCTGILIGSASSKAAIKALEEHDVIVDITGIIFPDTLGPRTFSVCMSEGFRFFIGKMLGKPVIKYTADSGPFNLRWNRLFARFYLGHFIDFMLARCQTTYRDIKALGVKTPIKVVPDTAFLLPLCQSEKSRHYAEVRKKGSLIGISVSYQSRNRASGTNPYINIMINFINYLIAKGDFQVVIIPNELSKSDADDMKIAKEICGGVNNSRCEVLQVEELTAQEIKGVVNECDAVVAARYHNIVASLSLGIPTLAIGWHHKYEGVLELFGQQRHLCDIKELALEDLIKKFEDLWNNREEIRKTITSFVPGVKERIIAGAQEVCNIVSAKSN